VLPTLIVVLLIPTVISHRTGKRSLNRALGIMINGITTLALIASVGLLVRALPSHKESPLELLRSGGLLWLTNVIVFALWYWRLDGGGPTLRHESKNLAAPVSFPQMQVPHDERAQFGMQRVGDRASLIIYSLPSPRARPSDRPMRRYWHDGPKCSP